MKLQNGLKKFLVVAVVAYVGSASFCFAQELNVEQIAEESQLYVEGGIISIGQNKGAARVAADGGTHCNRLKKLDYSYSAPLIEDAKQSSVLGK